ncbi:hypothetical protein BJ684DRAFT_22170 [Piptocephalis cylindrospora]|uniref:GCS light chain n=1 Tax=Piptocephalis cylindrospora TaxID=1907219 RepID=A0A4V1IXJ5_9FUNG|nr:hypothetical protein BJ684DRAFT_22170 [Piptocephalis cylindrospora]|eukprot:RKP11279.1 hypothetical protein BJ684DRAFT_22170 [Piptocephalis cylindrospora]
MACPPSLDTPPKYDRLVITSGNIMLDGASASTIFRTSGLRASANEVCTVLDEALSTAHDRVKPWCLDDAKGILYVPDDCQVRRCDVKKLATKEEEEEAEPEQVIIVAKIFLLSNALPPTFSPSKDIPFLIQTLHRQLDGSSSGSVLDSIVLSVDGITYDEMDDQGRQEIPSVSWQGLLDVWQAVEALKKDGKVSRIGVSELNLGSLEKLSKSVEIQPDINHLSLNDCCVFPKSLVKYAKEHRIELLTHGDATAIMPKESFDELVKKHHLTPESGLIPRWVTKYSLIHPERNVVLDKGYIVIADTLKRS